MMISFSRTVSRRMSLLGLALLCASAIGIGVAVPDSEREPAQVVDRSPVDVVLTPDEQNVLTANQTSGTISLVRCDSGKVVCEVACGQRPSAIALTPDGNKVLVTATWSGELCVFERQQESLKPAGSLWLGFEPRGVVVSPDGSTAYVALTTAHEIAVVDLNGLKEISRIAVGKWPRYLALSPDGKRLAVGVSGDGGVTVVDTEARK